jgi:hypothetical protein
LLPLDGLLSSSPFDAANAGKSKRIFQKKDLIEAVRRVNAPIVLPARDTPPLSKLHFERETSFDPQTNHSSNNKDISQLEDGVHVNARKYNERKRVAAAKEKELHMIVDQYKMMEIETYELSKMQNLESSGAKEIQRLNAEIEECMLSMEEKMHTRRQLEHMVRRLQSNQVKFDSHIAAMSVAVEASAKEAEEVKILTRQLEAGKSRTVHMLQEYVRGDGGGIGLLLSFFSF